MSEQVKVTAEDIHAGKITSFVAFGQEWQVKYVKMLTSECAIFGFRIIVECGDSKMAVSYGYTQDFIDGLHYESKPFEVVTRKDVVWVGDKVYIPHTSETLKGLLGSKTYNNSTSGIVTLCNSKLVIIGNEKFNAVQLLQLNDENGNPVGICLDAMPSV